jgi:ribosomal protein L11 methyltransferase
LKPESLRIKSEILAHIHSARFKITPLQLQKELQLRHPAFDRKLVRACIRDLVDQGELIYSFHYGTHYLEASFEKPIRVSPHVILKPPGLAAKPNSMDIVISIEKGAAFGSGMHPTTRLALRAIDKVCGKGKFQEERKHLRALDIGTGSGVLAVAAAAFGFGEVWGVDVDSCALAEAARNVHLNGLDDAIRISAEMPNIRPAAFHLLMANLRTPSLLELAGTMVALMADQGRLVLSGIRLSEEDSIRQRMGQNGLTPIWRAEEAGWLGAAFLRSQRPYFLN